MKMRTEYTCPLELVHDMIKEKWKPIILWRLRLGPTSLAKLERDIDGITQKMLLEQLKELMDYGFVGKKTFEGYPLHVEYLLTKDMGLEILEALKIMLIKTVSQLFRYHLRLIMHHPIPYPLHWS